MKVNYKSDFDAILRLTDCEGNDLGWPKFDWKAKFYTFSLSNVFTASCIGGVTENCYNDGGGDSCGVRQPQAGYRVAPV